MSNASADVLEKGTALHATTPQEAVSRTAGYAAAARPSRIANPGTLCVLYLLILHPFEVY
jgi:hypothetical protein